MGTLTSNLDLYKPIVAETGWADEINANFDTIDRAALYINVKASPYNATGDGVTDDTSAVAAALAASANQTLYFPTGTYLLNTSLSVVQDNVHIVGDGIGRSILKKKDDTVVAPILVMSQAPNCVIEGLTFDFNRQNQSSTGTVVITMPEWAGAKGPSTFRDCEFRNVPSSGIALKQAHDVLIDRCRFQGQGMALSGTGVELTGGCNHVTIRDSVFRYMNQGVVVSGQNNRYVVIDGNDIEMGWWYLKTYLTHTNSGGTVTYGAGSLTDTAASFPDFGANQRYVRAMPTLESGSSGSTHDRCRLTHSTKDFVSAGVIRGHIIRVSGKLAVVESVTATTLNHEGWIDASTYEQTALPADGTTYTVYGPILGRLEANSSTFLDLYYGGWRALDGSQAATPTNGTLYEVIETNNYPVHVVVGNPGVRVSNNSVRRSFSDFFEMQAEDCQVVGNTLYGGQDLGVAVVNHRGLVVGNKIEFCGAGGIYVSGHGTVVTGNVVTDSTAYNQINEVFMANIWAEAGASGYTITGNSCEFTSAYNIENDRFNIGVAGHAVTNTNGVITGNFVAGHSVAGIQLYGTGGGAHTITVANNNVLPTVVGTNWTLNANGVRVGSGTPEGAVTAPVGSLFLRSDGGASTTLYVKQSGTGNTGWVAK